MYHLPLSAVANAIKTRRVLATRKPTLSGLKVCNAPRVYTAAYSRRLRCLSVYLALADWLTGWQATCDDNTCAASRALDRHICQVEMMLVCVGFCGKLIIMRSSGSASYWHSVVTHTNVHMHTNRSHVRLCRVHCETP